jgi:hypothetical protein
VHVFPTICSWNYTAGTCPLKETPVSGSKPAAGAACRLTSDPTGSSHVIITVCFVMQILLPVRPAKQAPASEHQYVVATTHGSKNPEGSVVGCPLSVVVVKRIWIFSSGTRLFSVLSPAPLKLFFSV